MGQGISKGILKRTNNTINFAELNRGVYFLNVFNKELNKQNTYKLIKE